MQGKKQFQAELFSMVNIEELIPKGHFLRRLDTVLNLSFIHDLTKNLYCESNGRPSIDPEIFFRMCLVGYLYGISSDRHLCDELKFNLAYRWYCRLSLADEIPDHSSMTRIRDRLGEKVFEQIFDQILKICRENKLLKDKGEILFDSSHIPANAALNSLVKRNASEEEVKNRPNIIRGRKFRNETHISCSDPDAALSGKTGIPKGLYYKVHSAVDAKSRIILDPHVTSGNVHDGKALLGRIDYVEENRQYEVKGIVADRAYGFGENLQELKARKIETHIGTFHRDACGNVKDLEYDKKKDRLKCPSGHWLYGKESASAKNTTVYTFKNRPCTGCEQRNQCPVLKNLKREKSMRVNSYHPVITEAATREKTEKFALKLRERMWKIEGLFAEAKGNHCLDRAKYRGREKVQIQAYLIAMVQNLKRLVTQAAVSLLDLIVWMFQEQKLLKTFSLT